MKQDRKLLEENLIEPIMKVKKSKKLINDIKKHLATYDIIDVQGWINDPQERLPEMDIRELVLFSEQIYQKTGNSEINPNDFFTPVEIKESRQFSGTFESKQNEISFPLTFSNATVVGNSAYMVTMNIQTINKLMENNLLYYNFETQREAKYTKRKDQVIIEPTLNKNSVKEITEHLLNGTLVPTVLVFNCETRSATSGEEIIYNSKNQELTITSGSRVSITDGFHRITASLNALQVNPELDFNFAVLITNYSIRMSQQYMAQISKATPVSTVRIQELEANRLSDVVVQQLKTESELKGRISQTNRIHSLNREICTYSVLADAIEDEFKMETKLDSMNVGDFLVEFFDYLIGSFSNEFINNLEQARNETLLVNNNFFIGYITLARKLYEAEMKPKEIVKIVKSLDMSKENPTWQKLGILDDKGNISETNKARKAIRQYFEQIEIG